MPKLPPIVEATVLSPEQVQIEKEWTAYWRKLSQELPLQSMARVEDAARQMVGITGTLQGLFLAAFAFSEVRSQIQGPRALLFLVPVVLWLASLGCATRVFVPREWQGANRNDLRLEAWEDLRATVERALKEKQAWLNRSHLLLLLSYLVIIMLMGYWLLARPASSEPAPTRIVLLTPTPAQATVTPTPAQATVTLTP